MGFSLREPGKSHENQGECVNYREAVKETPVPTPNPGQDRGSEPGGEGRDPREFQGAAARVTSSDPVQTPEQQFANKKSRSEVSSAKVTQYIGSNDGRSPIKDIFKR